MPLTILTTEFWVQLFGASSSLIPHVKNPVPLARLHFNNGLASRVSPLTLTFETEDVSMEQETKEHILKWLHKIKKKSSNIHLHSYATSPCPHQTQPQKQMRAKKQIRMAFNRAIITKSFLEQNGICSSRLIIHASGHNLARPTENIHICLS